MSATEGGTMGRIWSALAAALAGAIAASLVVVLVGAGGGAAPAEAAPKAENATGPSLARLLRLQKATDRRVRAAIKRSNANRKAIAAISTTPGVSGTPGSPGATGATGATGPRGKRGKRGKPGEMGPRGKRGKRGKPGATGATGPRGKRGRPGPAGETGPQGPAGLSAVETVQSGVQTIDAGASDNHSKACPAGKVAIAGGVRQTNAAGTFNVIINGSGNNISVTASARAAVNQWNATVENPTGSQQHWRVSVICAIVDP